MKSTLLKNQIEAENHLDAWKVGALFMEAGTGKTRVALDIVNNSPCDFCLWICPLRTIDNVKEEAMKWGGFNMPVLYVGIESIQASSRIYLNVISELENHKNPFIVVDESLKIKNAEAKRTKRVLQLGKMAEYKLILNGTPLSRNLMDLWPQMEFISPKILGMSIRQFKNTFCSYTTVTKRERYKTYTKEYITGFENIDYLYSLIRHYVYECDLTMAIKSNYQVLKYSIDGEELKEYERIKDVGLERMIDKNVDKKISMVEYFKSKTKEQIIKEL